ncbi:MAG: radical SAM protein [Prevotellaceae bacterium]|jgi:radical SAM protein with 4Fe4S-binding SPASM domain|nr:radical SAM protein [Prevotellaceae bacterium]
MINLPHIAFEITDRCNLDCVYCYNIWKMSGAKHTPFNSYQKATATLQELFKQADIKSVALTGGEPFLSERFLETALFCRMAGKQVTLISNGTQGKTADYKQLIRMGVALFELPVHSAQAAIHDRMAQRKGSWQKSVSSIKSILELGGYVVPVVVITKHNVNLLGETLDFIQSIGCKRVMLNRYNIGGRGCARPMEVSATAEELRNAFATAEQKAVENDLRLTANVCSPICLLNPADYPHIGFGHCSFNPLQRPITLDINGNIRLCNHSPVVAGNIFETDLSEILFSDYSDLWEKSVPEFCAECAEWKKCKGGCRAASEQCFGSLAVEDPVIRVLGVEGLARR